MLAWYRVNAFAGDQQLVWMAALSPAGVRLYKGGERDEGPLPEDRELGKASFWALMAPYLNPADKTLMRHLPEDHLMPPNLRQRVDRYVAEQIDLVCDEVAQADLVAHIKELSRSEERA